MIVDDDSEDGNAAGDREDALWEFGANREAKPASPQAQSKESSDTPADPLQDTPFLKSAALTGQTEPTVLIGQSLAKHGHLDVEPQPSNSAEPSPAEKKAHILARAEALRRYGVTRFWGWLKGNPKGNIEDDHFINLATHLLFCLALCWPNMKL